MGRKKSGWYGERRRHSEVARKGVRNRKDERIKIFNYAKARDGTEFEIRATGQTWTLYYKKPQGKWKRIQSSIDARFLEQVMYNQREFR